MRLDFEAFTTLGPATTTEVGGGICVDSFVASAVRIVIYSIVVIRVVRVAKVTRVVRAVRVVRVVRICCNLAAAR